MFADEVRNFETFDEEYHGCVVVKEDKRSGCQGAAAIIMCSPAGQIALGAPGPKTKSNGEQTLCHNLNMVDAATRRALHGSPIFSEVTTELKELVQAKLIEDGLLRVGGTVAAITEWELRADTSDELRALAALLAVRGFVCRAGGQLIIFLAANEDMIDAEFKSEPRSLSNTMHGLEYLEKARWGRWRRYGPTEVVPTDSEQLKELKKVRAKNSAKGGACAQPNPSPSRVPNLSSHSPSVSDSLWLPSQARSSRSRMPTSGGARRRSARSRSSISSPKALIQAMSSLTKKATCAMRGSTSQNTKSPTSTSTPGAARHSTSAQAAQSW